MSILPEAKESLELFCLQPNTIDDFQKFCRSGLDRIQFYRIRTGLGLKNFTVRSSLALTENIPLNIKK